MKKTPRLCVYCVHFQLDFGVPDWSDLTPGDPAVIRCYEGHFHFTEREKIWDFRTLIERARKCRDFKRHLQGEKENRKAEGLAEWMLNK